METIVIKPQGVCSREMTIEVEDGIIVKASHIGGCQGNLEAVCQLCVGHKVERVIERLEGIKCRGSRNGETSCPDQLAKGLKSALK